MNSEARLSATQYKVLAHAIRKHDGQIIWFPDFVWGAARQRVLAGLHKRALVTTDGTDWFVAPAAYDFLGFPRPAAAPDAPGRTTHKVRDNTKIAKVIAALRNPTGATIFDLMRCTGWAPHTVRGAISGTVKKRLGLNVVSAMGPEGEWSYRIA